MIRAAEPLMEAAAHCVPNPLKAGKIETIQRSQPQLPQAAVEMSVQYPAGSPADWGNVRGCEADLCYNKAYKGCAAALIDGSDQVFIGFFTEALRCNDLILL